VMRSGAKFLTRASDIFFNFILMIIACLFLAMNFLSFLRLSPILNPKNINFGVTTDALRTGDQWISLEFRNKWTGFRGNPEWHIYQQDNWFQVRPQSGKGSVPLEVALRNIKFEPGSYKSRFIIHFPSHPKLKVAFPINLKVYDSVKTLPPFGWLDLPQEGEKIKASGCLVAGWALDDIEVREVWVKREPIPGDAPEVIDGDGLVVLGQASLRSGVRPDVELLYSKIPLNYRAGWGFNLKPEHYGKKRDIQLKLYAVFIDKEGHSTYIGPRTVYIEKTRKRNEK